MLNLYFLFFLLLLNSCIYSVSSSSASSASSFSSTSSSSSFSLGIRDSIMIAHSFKGEQFGPAQRLHGATYTVDVDITRDDIEPESNWVIDIGEFSDTLSEVLKEYNFYNLNDIFPTENTTTEFMCRAIHRNLANKLQEKCKGGKLRVKLFESHKAWASFSSFL